MGTVITDEVRRGLPLSCREPGGKSQACSGGPRPTLWIARPSHRGYSIFRGVSIPVGRGGKRRVGDGEAG
jgi:hypothetical protein